MVNLHRLFSLLSMVTLTATGCALQDQRSVRSGPINFPHDRAVPRVIIYGPLEEFLPQFDATPLVDRFLYGPNDYGKTALRNPQGMALAGDVLLVCDQGQPDVVAINLLNGKSKPWGDSEHRPRCPVDVTVDQQGRVYVADTTLRCILVYDADEGFIETLTPAEDSSSAFRPCGVLAHGGVVYIGNLGHRRIERWKPAERRWLEPLMPPAEQGSLIAPTGIGVTNDNVLLIADAVRSIVFRVTTDGNWLTPIGKPGRGPGQFVRPKQVCSTPAGMVLVADAGRQSVLVFNDQGQYVMEVHEKDGAWEGWTLPMGLIALSSSSLPFVTESGKDAQQPPLDDYIIVSDSLGGTPLTVLGVVVRRAQRDRDGQ